MKRTPKPFTVEVRRSVRRRPIPLIVSLKDPLERPTPLPDQDERSPKPIKGRILLALEHQKPVLADRSENLLASSQLEMETDEDAKELIGAAPENIAYVPVSDIDEKTLRTRTQSLSVVRAKKPVQGLRKEEFRRGERWKHRLPKVVHRKHAKHSS